MINLKILDFKDILTDELQQSCRWVIAYIEPLMAWPVSIQKITYLGQEFWIIPITNDAYPAIAIRSNGEDDQSLRERILRF